MKILLSILFYSFLFNQNKVVKTYQNGEKRFEGNYKKDKIDGTYTFWYENGQKSYEENYKDGLKVGRWTGWYENGHKSSEKYYKNNIREGKWITWYDNGQKSSQRIYINGKVEGFDSYWDLDGKKYREVLYDNGLKNGHDIIWYKNGRKREESKYKDNILISKKHWTKDGLNSGEFILYHTSGDVLLKGKLKNNKYEGEFLEYGYFGRQDIYHKHSLRNYRQGKLHGEFVRFFDTGDINTVANYVDGKLEGTYVFYDMDGKKYWEGLYKDNQLMNERSYIGIKGPFRLN